jgi:hypothetical protein
MLHVKAAAFLLAAHMSGFGLSASPAGIHDGQPHHSYVISVRNTGTQPETVYSVLSRATDQGGTCVVDSSHPDSMPWVHLRSAPVFRLSPGASRAVRVRIGTPPPGKTQIVIEFLTREHGSGSVVTSAGVGTSILFTQPGHSASEPCKKASAAPVATASGPSGVLMAMGAALLAGLGAVIVRWRRRHARYRGRRRA